ncbi:MAG: DUF1540 domain-containing protein [Lachnospirales bacterium]
MPINCSVHNCNHNENSSCTKDSITVSKSADSVKKCCDTECNSFES